MSTAELDKEAEEYIRSKGCHTLVPRLPRVHGQSFVSASTKKSSMASPDLAL
jgi:hypothetical protein